MTEVVVSSPQLNGGVNHQRHILRSVLSKFGSSPVPQSTPPSTVKTRPAASTSSSISAVSTHHQNSRDKFSIDEDDDVDSVVDPESLFRVVSSADGRFVVEGSMAALLSPKSQHSGSKASGPDDDGDGEDDLLSFEEVLRSCRLPTHDSKEEEPDDDFLEEQPKEVASPSPQVSNRKMIKSLPRLFKPLSINAVPIPTTESATDALMREERVLHDQSAEEAKRLDRTESTKTPDLVDSVPSSPEEMKRKMLKDLSRRFRGSKEKVWHIEMTEEMKQLETALTNKLCKCRLTDALLAEKVDLLVKMHFCCAVTEYQQMQESRAKRLKGKKILKIFLTPESMFRVHGVPQQIEQHLLIAKRFEYLDILRLMCLEELASSEAVLKVLFGSKRNVLAL